MPPRDIDTSRPAAHAAPLSALASSHERVAARELATRDPSMPIVPIVVASVVAHVAIAVVLGALGPVRLLGIREDTLVAFDVADVEAPPPPPVVEPPPPPPPAATPPPTLRPRAPEPTPEPTPLTPEPPPPEPTAAPPSVDDVFGEEPAPAAPILTAEGASGGPAMDPGQAGGVPGGRSGGTGEGVGTQVGGGSGQAPAGPSEADIRRARRAYVRSLEGLLGGRVRYPRALERAGVGGRVELCIRIADDGRVLGSRVCGTAGQSQLDDAALDAAHALDRVPAPPALASWSSSDEIHAGILFRVQ